MGKSFTDSQGRGWEVTLNVAAMKAVREATGVNLYDVIEGNVLARLAEDPVFLVDVLYVLCREQCRDRAVTDEQFGRAMGGDAVEQAAAALLDELVAFFPKSRREVLGALLTKTDQLRETAAAMMTKALAGLTVGDLTAALSSGSPGSSPASPASTPAA